MVKELYTTNAMLNMSNICKIVKEDRISGGYVLVVSFVDGSKYDLFFKTIEDRDNALKTIEFSEREYLRIYDTPLMDNE